MWVLLFGQRVSSLYICRCVIYFSKLCMVTWRNAMCGAALHSSWIACNINGEISPGYETL